MLEQILSPLAEWSRTRAELEQWLLTVRRGQPDENRPSGSLPDSHYGRGDLPFGAPPASGSSRSVNAEGTPLRQTHAPDLRQIRTFAPRAPMHKPACRTNGAMIDSTPIFGTPTPAQP